MQVSQVAEIVIEVLRRLNANSNSETTLLVGDGHLDVSLDIMQDFIGDNIVKIDEHDALTSSKLQNAKQLVIWPCSQNTLAGAALGMTNTYTLKWVATALWNKTPVLMVLENELSSLLRSDDNRNSYSNMFLQYITTLSEFGVKVLFGNPSSSLSQPMSNISNDQHQDSDLLKTGWWTITDLNRQGVVPGKLFEVPKGIRLTPAAKDALLDMKAVIRYWEDKETAKK